MGTKRLGFHDTARQKIWIDDPEWAAHVGNDGIAVDGVTLRAVERTFS
jgi:hypothetical protein